MSLLLEFPGKLLLAMLAVVAMATAQSVPATSKSDTGFTSYVEFDGTSNAEGQVYRLNSSVGYSFTEHFGIDVGVPIYFLRPSSSVTGTTGSTSANGLGNPYLDLRVKFLNPAVNFASVLTGYAPAGDSKLGLSTGRATFDWTNHFDHSFNSLTPFFEAGLSNTVADTQLFLRPFTSLGMNSHFQGGVSYQLGRYFNVGASGYDIQPFGQQTLFSKVTGKGQTPGQGAASSHGPFQNNQQVTGSSDLAYDNGFSAWVGASPSPYMDLQLGYTRSIQYDLNSVSFGIGVNVGRLYHRSASR